MVAVNVAWDGTRVDAADGGSNTANIGGGAGAGAEPDILYQGSGGTPEEVSRKIGTSAGGFAITPLSTTDASTATGTYQTFVLKYAAANAAALELLSVPGLQARIGSASGVYAQYDFAGSDAYPEKGGFIFLCADPNITGYHTATVGSPAYNALDYYGIVGDFTATSKSENLVHSAVDVGNGYTVTGGGGADPTADYQDIADFNTTLANRHGFFFALEGEDGAYGQYGKVVWGSSGTAVDYQDTSSPTVFLLDGFFAAGWSGIEDNLENAGTVINPVGGSFIGRGDTTTTDTRPVYNAVGTAATGTTKRTGQRFVNFAQFNAVSIMEYEDCDIQSADFTHDTATLTNCTLRSTALVNVAMTDDFTPADATGLTVVQEGGGHFWNIGTVSTDTSITWDVTLSGFPAGTTGSPATTTSNGDEALLCNVASGQTLTINVNGGTTPSVKNDGPGDVNIVSSVPINITINDEDNLARQGAQVLFESISVGPPETTVDEIINQKTGVTGILVGSYSGSIPGTARFRVRDSSGSKKYKDISRVVTIGVNGFTTTETLERQPILEGQ